MRKLGVLLAFLFTLLAVPVAGAAPVTDVFDGKIPCTTQGDGVRTCSGPGGAVANTVRSWDETPIDVNVALPSEADFGPPPYPLAMYFHGFGGGKEGFNGDLKRFTDRGIAAFSMTERGFKDSCGRASAIEALELAGEDCSKGFIHLMDTRHEVRDAQYLSGVLVDEGLVVPDKIGSVGASYGGGKSMALAALKNRIMLPDGTLAPWRSPAGTSMELAASAPIVPWTDFAYALLPNGRTLDYVVDSPYDGPYGVMKSGLISALLPSGDNFSGENGPVDPNFDVLGWKALMEAGEPYSANPQTDFMFSEMTQHHSSYYIDDSVKPAPLLIAQGFTDDLFPVDEALRYYNRTKFIHPDAEMSLLFADIGHPRAPLTGENSQGRPADQELGFERVQAWFEHYLLDDGPKPVNGVEVKTQVCPYTEPSGGPYSGATWPAMAPGELRLTDPDPEVIESDAGLADVAFAFSSISDGCVQRAVTAEPGTVTYSFGTVPEGGYTLMGAPTVISKIDVANGDESQIAARLWEISADRKQRLIARGVYRPDASGAQVFQLHGNAYRFAPGTEIQLQLLPKDGTSLVPLASYVRPSNDQRPVTVSDVEVRLPLAEQPGSRDGVAAPLPKVLPDGSSLAIDYTGIGSVSLEQWANPSVANPPVGKLRVKRLKVKGKKLRARITCPASASSCGSAARFKFRGSPKGRKARGRGALIARGRGAKVAPGKSKRVSFRLTAKGRKLFAGSKRTVRRKGKRKVVKIRGLKKLRVRVSVKTTGSRSASIRTAKRTGKVQ